MKSEDDQARTIKNTISAYPQKALDILGIPMSQVERHLKLFPIHFVATILENKFTLIKVFYHTTTLHSWCEETLLDFGHLVFGMSPEEKEKLLIGHLNAAVYTLPEFLRAVVNNEEGDIEFNTNKAAVLRDFDSWTIGKKGDLEQKWREVQVKKVLGE